MRCGMTRVLKIAAAIVCLTALAAGAGTIIQRKKAALAQAPRYGQSPTPVWVAKARLGSLEIRRDYLAVVEPARTADLQSRLTSRIEAIAVNESELVRKDQPLIVLDDREITHTIDVVRAQIAQTEAEYSANEATVSSLQKSVTFWEREAERMKRLLTTGASSISATESVIDKTD